MLNEEVIREAAGDIETIRQQFRDARTDKGYTQVSIAEQLSLTQSYVAQYEGGFTNPSIMRIAQMLRVCGKKLVVVDDAA